MLSISPLVWIRYAPDNPRMRARSSYQGAQCVDVDLTSPSSFPPSAPSGSPELPFVTPKSLLLRVSFDSTRLTTCGVEDVETKAIALTVF